MSPRTRKRPPVVAYVPCAECGRTYALRKDGTIRHHLRNRPGSQWDRPTCPGAGRPPEPPKEPEDA